VKEVILKTSLDSPIALVCVAAFVVAYLFVILEDFTKLKKSKPLIIASSLIWIMVAYIAHVQQQSNEVNLAIRHHLSDYVELLLFLIVAITYINVLTERKVFDALRSFLIKQKFSYRKLFWLTGILAFFMSALADNLTTSLALSAVIIAVGKENLKFTSIACINLVVAANAGGVFSPFGDMTTLMVWQAGLIPFTKFFKLFLPAVVNYLIPALCMHFALPTGHPTPLKAAVKIAPGGKQVVCLFLLTIVLTVSLQNFLQLPPALGMMLGLGLLQLFSYYTFYQEKIPNLAIFPAIKELDWDTLLFFYGIIMAIGGLATLGYLEVLSNTLYANWLDLAATHYHQAPGNIAIGLLSAILDNIPLMFSVITMNPVMSEGQWLLLTLTTGVGGSLLSIGSAAGVGVMGQAPSVYTFFTHLKWTWAILLGYIASIACHFWWNALSF
jgi:Na+/H+ antiporter NhaD/arsenite permease-like protein